MLPGLVEEGLLEMEALSELVSHCVSMKGLCREHGIITQTSLKGQANSCLSLLMLDIRCKGWVSQDLRGRWLTPLWWHVDEEERSWMDSSSLYLSYPPSHMHTHTLRRHWINERLCPPLTSLTVSRFSLRTLLSYRGMTKLKSLSLTKQRSHTQQVFYSSRETEISRKREECEALRGWRNRIKHVRLW
jgi:hypothetical protein